MKATNKKESKRENKKRKNKKKKKRYSNLTLNSNNQNLNDLNDQLENLYKEIKNCKKCRLWKTRKNAVPGEGNSNAEIMIIGQAPGKEEDKSGKPFIGRAGKLLDDAFLKLNKKREDFFITSILKCFPPANRKPKQDEIKACLPYTLKQIEIIKPKAILLLGEIATNALLGISFKEAKGKFIEKNGIKYFTTYHPAAVLRFPKIKEKFFKDLEKFFRK